MKKLLLGVLLVASSYGFSQAQNNLSEYEAQYQKALLFYQNNDFEKARIAFSQLSNLRFNNPIVPYSYYFQALAAIKVGKYAEAESSLQNLQLRYPNWEKNEEVAYLYATIAFENKDYAKGLQIANAINSDSLKNDLKDLKKNFLSEITDPKKLTSLSEQFPEEILLKERIQAKSSEMSSTKDLQQYRLNKGFLNFAFYSQ
jgi:outer membrane protein assembly factor BamD (BamD/ComL family)